MGNVKPDKIRIFMSPETEAKYNAAYDAVLQHWPVHYEELYIHTRFGNTHVISSGIKDNDPLVFLASSGAAATQWFRNVGPLSQHYCTYAVDLIGEVNKSIPDRPIRNSREFADWVADLFDGLKIESAYMVGNSFGGFLTLNTAFYLPNRVKKIVLISPAATFVQIWAWYWHLLIPAHIIAPLIKSERMVQKAYAWLWQGFPMDERFGQLRDYTKIAAYPRYRVSRNPAPPKVFSDSELREIRTPVLLLIGDHEVIYDPKKVIRRATRLMADVKAEIVPNANHNAQITAADTINKEILDFFLDL
jgi:pimeloyl-ACP methyl ester carboxylesterase